MFHTLHPASPLSRLEWWCCAGVPAVLGIVLCTFPMTLGRLETCFFMRTWRPLLALPVGFAGRHKGLGILGKPHLVEGVVAD